MTNNKMLSRSPRVERPFLSARRAREKFSMRRRSFLLALVVASLLATASAQPNKGGGGMGDKKPKPGAPSGPGKDRPPASGKTPAAGKLAFDAATGRLKGTWAGATIPSYRTPMAAPLLGTVGYATDTTLIYGPFEAGFGSGATATSSSDARPPYPCKDGSTYSGYCPGGMDVQTCETTLFKTCASGTVRKELFMDECGGHAKPYHIHMDPVCLYTPGADGHSAVVGVMLDGAPLYGRHETTGTPPADLDACGGHTGPVGAYDEWGIPDGARVYHYHAQTKPPFLLGCYGPVDSRVQCERLYQSGTRKCGDASTVAMSGSMSVEYDLWCPCYDSTGKHSDSSDSGGGSDDGVVAAPSPPRPPGLPDGYDTWEEYNEEQQRKAEYAKKEAEKKKEREEKLKKEREEKEEEAKKKRREEKEKKEEMETKKKALEEKKKEAEDKRTKLMEERKKAYAKRDAMLAVLKNATADAKAEKRAKVLADAAIAGKNITRMKIKKSAASKDAACDDAFAGMPSVNTSHAFCNATEAAAPSGRRRGLLQVTEYEVTIEVNPEEVNVTAAVTELQTVGITDITTTTVDPLVELSSVEGVATSDLTALETEVVAAAAVQAEVAAIEAQVDTTAGEVADIETEVEAFETEAASLEAEADVLGAEVQEAAAEAAYAESVAEEEDRKAKDAADAVAALPPRSDDGADVDIVYVTKPKGGAAGLAGLFTAIVAAAAAFV